MIGVGADQVETGQSSGSSKVNSTVQVADISGGNSELEVCMLFIKALFLCLNILFGGF